MGYFLGIDVGASRTVAAVAWSGTGDAETAELGDPEGDGQGVASVLHLGADGALAVGAAARRWAPTEPDRVVEGFPGRIGDGDPMLLAGEPWAPEELTAWLVRWVVDRVAEREGTEAEAVAVARPASWDDARTGLLAAAAAEQELDVRFLAPGGPATGTAAGDAGAGDPQVAAAVAVALRTAAVGERPSGTTASGRHAVVGGAIAALAAPADGSDRSGTAWAEPDAPEGDGPSADPAAEHRDAEHRDAGPVTTDGEDAEHPEGGTGDAVPDEGGDADDRPRDAGDLDGDGAAPSGIWDVPAPRSHQSGAYDPRAAASDAPDAGGPGTDGSDGDEAGGDEPGRGEPGRDEPGRDEPDGDGAGGDGAGGDGAGGDGAGGDGAGGDGAGGAGHRPDPATVNLVAELVGFTGGMGATNTAGLLSGYTPPHGMPSAWAGGRVALAPAEDATVASSGDAVALPSQRSSSGRWSTVAPAPADLPAAPALRARNNPTVLVGAGGLAAAVVVVSTLFLWPAPRITNSATSRPVVPVPVATAPAEPTAAPTVAVTPEPTPTPRPRPATPRTRRPVVPPVTVPESAALTTPPPTEGTEPAEPTTSLPPSTEENPPTSAEQDDD